MAVMAKTATLASIARECGVSTSTVSRAFSRPELVKADVREHILAVARRRGYQPNRIARGLATGRLGMIGLIVSDITNPFFPPLVRTIQHAVAGQDWSLMLLDAEEMVGEEAAMIDWVRGQVDGVIVASPRSTEEQLVPLLASLPSVVINREVHALPCVVFDHADALAAAGDHLRTLGHREFALIRGPQDSWAAGQRAQAIVDWATRSGSTLIDLGHYTASFEAGREAGRALAESSATAAFAFDDLMCMGVLSGLDDHGLEVPEDVSLVGCDDVLLARTSTPSLTTVAVPMERLGESAVTMLQEAINGAPPRIERLPGQLALRDSVGPARGAR